MSQQTTRSNAFGVSDTAKAPASAVKAKTESQTLIAANPARVAAYITNDGEKTVYLAFGATAVKNEGIRLLKGDPPLYIDTYTGIITVVTAAEESVVCFTEI
jgi:DNA-binding beta-propeller fold protein YncE